MSNDLKKLQQLTKARVALGRSGNAISTQDILKFNADRAMACDAVQQKWNIELLKENLKNRGENFIEVASEITSREQYLKRPDLGRVLNEESCRKLKVLNTSYDVVFIISDGLSAFAVGKHFLPLWGYIKNKLSSYQLNVAPLVLAPFSRVALSDGVGFYLNARVSIILIGERPGLSACDSLGIYLTYGPKFGNLDSGRNCISNIRPPDGLSYESAANKLIFLLRESLKQQLSGVLLKEELESPNAHKKLLKS